MSGKIFVIGGYKGGPGKSLTTIELAVAHKLHGKDPILVDTDVEETAPKSTTYWAAMRKENKIEPYIPSITKFGKNIAEDFLYLAQEYDVFIDIGANKKIELTEALSVADKAIFPIHGGPFEMWPIIDFVPLINRMKAINKSLKTYLYFNKVSTHQYDARKKKAIDYLIEHNLLDTFNLVNADLKLRSSFINSKELGMSVLEMKRKDEKAVSEVLSLYEEIIND
jgi:chromosome partitioning protein